MIFLLDENFPKPADAYLTQRGHQVIDIRGTELQGADDVELFKLAQQKKAILLTTDRDFYHTVPLTYDKHFGVIVIALKQPNRTAILSRLDWVLAQEMIDDLNDKILMIRDKTYRLRSNEE